MSRRLPDLEATARALRAGDVLLMATDTLPGLHCRADAPQSIARLRSLKGRPARKPLLLICADAGQAFGNRFCAALSADIFGLCGWFLPSFANLLGICL